MKAKLAEEPVEDLRIDFEDGYVGPDGPWDDAEEDAHVREAAHALAESQQAEAAPPFTGIRIKSFERPTRAPRRADADPVRGGAGGVPRVRRRLRGDPAQGDQHRAGGGLRARRLGDRGRAGPGRPVAALRDPGRDAAVGARARRHRAGGPDGPRVRRAADRRCTTAPTTTRPSAGSPPSSSRSSTRSPTTPSWSCRRPPPAPACASPTARPTCCRSATATRCTRPGSTTTGWSPAPWSAGFYQGWDLHPGQLPTRYAATYAFFRAGLPRALSRLQDYAGRRSSGDRRRAGHRAGAGRLRAARARLRRRRRRRGDGGVRTRRRRAEVPGPAVSRRGTLGSGHGGVGSQPVRQGGEPGGADRP